MILLYLMDRYLAEEGIDEFSSLFPKNSQLMINSENIDATIKLAKKSPLYSDGWFIKLYPYRVSVESIEIISNNQDNFILIICRSRDYAEELAVALDSVSLDYHFFNGSNKPKEEIKADIQKRLIITPTLAEYMGNRASWRLDYLEIAMEGLKGLKKITKKDINFFIPFKPNCSMDDVVEYFIGVRNDRTSKERFSVIKRYKKGYRFLFDILISRLELTLWIYNHMINGNLTRENYKEFRIKHIKEIREFGRYVLVSPYRFQRLVNSFYYVSYETVYEKYSLAVQFKKDKYSIGGFLLLIDLGG